jgi:L-threonylcarbamoyladenylate synthase
MSPTILATAVAMILDRRSCTVGIESTIVGFVDDETDLLAPRCNRVAELTRVLGTRAGRSTSAAPRAPGMLAAHYAPETPASLVAPGALHAELEQLAERDESIAVLARTVARPPIFRYVDRRAADAAAYAHDLYANLRALDDANADAILDRSACHGREWLAVRDRLERATRGEDDDRN